MSAPVLNVLIFMGIMIQGSEARFDPTRPKYYKKRQDVSPGNNVVIQGVQEGYNKHWFGRGDEPCGGQDVCEGKVCLCMCAGLETGFFHPSVSSRTPDNVVGGLNQKFKEVQAEQDRGGFVHLALITLPGSDSTHLRKLWETITSIVSENALMQEAGSTLNRRTNAYARECGGISVTARSPNEMNNDVTACMDAHRAKAGEPTLVLSMVDMQTERDINAFKDIFNNNTILVMLVRNPVDWFFASQKKNNQEDLADLRNMLDILVRRSAPEAAPNTSYEVQLPATDPLLFDSDLRKRLGLSVIPSTDPRTRRHELRLMRQTDLRELYDPDEDDKLHHDKRFPNAVPLDKRIKNAASKREAREARGKKMYGSNEDLNQWLPTNEVPFQYYAFNPWVLQQWQPYLKTMMDPMTWTERMHYVMRYEDLFDKPVETMTDFLVSTGVARNLKISDLRIQRLTRQVEHAVKQIPNLRSSRSAGQGFMGIPSEEIIKSLTPHKEILERFGYIYYYEHEAPQDINFIRKSQFEKRQAEQVMALRIQGDYHPTKDVLDYMRSGHETIALMAAPAVERAALLHAHVQRMQKENHPLVKAFYAAVGMGIIIFIIQQAVVEFLKREPADKERDWLNRIRMASQRLYAKPVKKNPHISYGDTVIFHG